jgi:hypothetical protein
VPHNPFAADRIADDDAGAEKDVAERSSSILGVVAGRFQVHGVTIMDRDYLITAGVFAGVAVLFAAILGSLGFVQSECLQGTPFLPLIFPCFQ